MINGIIFEASAIIPYLLKYKKDPVTGNSCSSQELVTLNMEHTHTHIPELPEGRNGIKDGPIQSQVHQHRIEHAITATIANDRYTTTYTLEIHPAKDDTATATNMITVESLMQTIQP